MYWIARVLAVVALLAVLLYGVGLLIPSERSTSKTTIIDAPPKRVYQTMTDVERQPQWRSDVRKVEDLQKLDGDMRSWNETRDGGSVVHVEERVKEPAKRYEVSFHDSDGVQGRWVAEFEPSNENRTKLTCTETRVTDRPLLRLPAMLLSLGGTNWDVYLGDLNRQAASEEEKPKEAWSPTPRPAATSPTATPSPTATATSTPTASPTPTPSPSASPSATPSAVPASSPSSTPSATPSATPKSTAAATPI